MQQPLYPATKPSLHSHRSERSLTALAPGVRGAAPLPAFLTPYKTGIGDLEAMCLHWRARRRGSRKRPARPARFPIFLGFSFKKEREKPLVRLDKGEEDFTRQLHGALHHSLHPHPETIYSRNQRIIRREEDRPVRGPNPGEAGATPAFDARCVTALHGVAPASLTVKIQTLDGEEFICTGSRNGFPMKKVRFSFCTSEIATSSLCRKRISRESKNLGENAKTKIASEKTKNRAGATPLFRLSAAQKVVLGSLPPVLFRSWLCELRCRPSGELVIEYPVHPCVHLRVHSARGCIAFKRKCFAYFSLCFVHFAKVQSWAGATPLRCRRIRAGRSSPTDVHQYKAYR